MNPPNPHALHTALDVETQRRDALAAQLLQLQAEQEAAQAQLEALEQYGRDTAGALAQPGAQHDAARLRHQQPFLQRLEQAIDAQRRSVAQAAQAVQQLQAAVVTSNQRMAALEALIARNLQRQRQKEQRQQQRQSDEAAAVQHQHRTRQQPHA